MMKTPISLFLLSLSMNANADAIILGQGRLDCAAFNQVVNGNFHSPLGALRFHGYISWAQGMLSGRNHQADAGAQVDMDTDSLKMALIDSCREHPQRPFADAVWQLGQQR